MPVPFEPATLLCSVDPPVNGVDATAHSAEDVIAVEDDSPNDW